MKPELRNNPKVSFLTAFIVLLVLTVAMFGDVLFTSKKIVLSVEWQDLYLHFVHWRKFGFDQLRQGNLALWNPHIYSGMPYAGMFESALLYPLNFIYLVLPLQKAVNFDIALHIFLTGVFMYLWTSHRKLHPLACLLSSVLLMFCGAHFLHIYPGHLSVLCTAMWAPLLFLAIDGLFEKHSLSWCLLGMFAVAMQILAGHPQYVFYTAVAAVIYSGLRIVKAGRRTAAVLGLICIYSGGIALGAVQLFTGIQAAGEGVRSGAMPYEFASHFSFPPENLVTLLAPAFFGNMTTHLYWGRCFLWEMSLFVGVTGLVLAVYGSVYGSRSARRFSAAMALILILLALGGHTPLFRVLYTWVPGFNKFRSPSKFIFQASLFITMLAGIGMDHLIRNGKNHRRIPIVILAAGFLIGIAALSIRHSAVTGTAGLWGQIMRAVYTTDETFLRPRAYTNPELIRKFGVFASKSLMVSSGTFLLLSALFFLVRFSKKAVYAIALLAMVEIFVFARASRPAFDFPSTLFPEMVKFSSEHSGDYRILCPRKPNSAMSLHMRNIWGGLGTVVPKRYAEFLAFTQGHDPNEVPPNNKCSRYHRLYRMLRCRYIFIPVRDRVQIMEIKDVMMQRLHIVQDYIVIQERDNIFKAMEDTAFDPWRKVILETLPEPRPVKSEEKGIARILDSSTDHLTIEADIPHPAILLITDAYSDGWRARALHGSVQEKYDVMPANYILRAIPLSKGSHHIRVEYLPSGFRIGKWVSIVSIIGYVVFLGLYFLRMCKKY